MASPLRAWRATVSRTFSVQSHTLQPMLSVTTCLMWSSLMSRFRQLCRTSTRAVLPTCAILLAVRVHCDVTTAACYQIHAVANRILLCDQFAWLEGCRACSADTDTLKVMHGKGNKDRQGLAQEQGCVGSHDALSSKATLRASLGCSVSRKPCRQLKNQWLYDL